MYTWFPSYQVQVQVLKPQLCLFAGGALGAIAQDWVCATGTATAQGGHLQLGPESGDVRSSRKDCAGGLSVHNAHVGCPPSSADDMEGRDRDGEGCESQVSGC